jgi:DNA-directed RNA polymerase specialized sigma24 family protein
MAILSRASLTAPNSYEAWLATYVRLVVTLAEPIDGPCPNCGRFELRFAFVADPATRLGFCALWCASCQHGAVISRVGVPTEFSLLDINQPAEELAAHIPDFDAAVPADEGGASTAAEADFLIDRIEELRATVAEYERLAVLLRYRRRADAITRAIPPSARRVLDLAAFGLSKRAIAAEMHISEDVVHRSLRLVMRKLSVRDADELATILEHDEPAE